MSENVRIQISHRRIASQVSRSELSSKRVVRFVGYFWTENDTE
jgi:hypothetical protein